MKKKLLGFIVVFVSIILYGFNAKANGVQSIRLWGNNRYSTNIKIIQQGWETSDYAIIVNGENFPDALSAAPLAKKYNAPIFLTVSPSLTVDADKELVALGVKKVFIIGGTAVVSTLIEDDLKSKGIEYERIYGDDRYLTSIAIANKIGTSNGVVVTTGKDYTDALSVAPIASKLQMPIILSPKDGLESIQKKFIENNSIGKTYVVGGTDLISENVASKFPNVQRIEGSDKYTRNLNIINTFADNIDFSKAILSSGENFPDALSGSAFGALNGNPIFLANENMNKSFIENVLGNKNTNTLYVLGGISSISDKTLNNIIGESSALNTIKSKIKLNSKLQFGAVGTYSYDGSNYYRIALYSYNENAKMYITDYYQYDFLVDIQTGDAYKIDNSTNKITALDITQIPDGSQSSNTQTSSGTLTIEQALELVKSKIKLNADETLDIPYMESQRIVTYNNSKCYSISRNYNNEEEICEYLVNINTGEITECNQGIYTPIK